MHKQVKHTYLPHNPVLEMNNNAVRRIRAVMWQSMLLLTIPIAPLGKEKPIIIK